MILKPAKTLDNLSQNLMDINKYLLMNKLKICPTVEFSLNTQQSCHKYSKSVCFRT